MYTYNFTLTKYDKREKWGSPSGDFPYSPSPKQLKSASSDRDAGGAKNPCPMLSGLNLPLKFSVCFPKVLRVHSNLLGHWMQDVRSVGGFAGNTFWSSNGWKAQSHRQAQHGTMERKNPWGEGTINNPVLPPDMLQGHHHPLLFRLKEA